MPFTLSHAILAPPLSKLSGNRLPIAALAIGTMTPDLYRVLVKTEIYLIINSKESSIQIYWWDYCSACFGIVYIAHYYLSF